ncbi:MAG: hypothetical protein D6813_09715 [Calditrichaeota bacterium]|nr:MAG: hypothetical protein D6813_09715 [Calditrichota bacterium]
MTQNISFFGISKRIAEDFLQTVIIIDDGADYPDKTSPKPHVGLQPPQESPLKSPPSDDQSSSHMEQSKEDEEDISHRLDAKAVMDSFARKGILCSVFLVDEADRESLSETAYSLASCSDIVVLDWSLQKDDGEKALEIIQNFLKQTLSEPTQLRLIAVYSGTPDIHKISDKIKEVLNTFKSAEFFESDDGFTLEIGYTKIVVFAKKGTMVIKDHESRIVSFEELADKLTDEFAMMTSGLVSNVVLKSLAQVRKNTPKILKNFSKGLDAPYLTHRALLSTPDDAKEHLVHLVAEELQAILEEAQIGETVNMDVIEAWIKSKNQTDFQLDDTLTFSQDELLSLLKNGFKESNKISKNQAKKAHKKPITKMFLGEEKETQFLDERFSLFTIMRSYYKQHRPRLTLGTILKVESETPEFWLCIQPRCDCVVRDKSSRAFPFLPLLIKGDNSKFDTVLFDENKYIRTQSVTNPFEIKLIHFKPSANEEIITAKEENDSYYFKDTENNKYKWMGELRFEHAQRISNEFAANISRVGLDESEWLRLWKTKG